MQQQALQGTASCTEKPSNLPGIANIHWEFLGDLLGKPAVLSKIKTLALLCRDFIFTYLSMSEALNKLMNQPMI